jgi:prolyl-tRNA editing enzyme YbaK/EbsC (Cys-tRNA(Pro) deacylase)
VPVGAVCPVLIGVPIYIDEKVMKIKKVNMGSGDLEKGLEMKLKDLLRSIDDYKVANLAS